MMTQAWFEMPEICIISLDTAQSGPTHQAPSCIRNKR